MNFSSRTNWPRQYNTLTQLLDARRDAGLPIFDLTVSNPTECGFRYPEQEILSAISDKQILEYKPDPRGMLSARKSVANYYQEKNVQVDPSHIFLTSGTSEAYGALFKLLGNAGDSILVPSPSYPLFEYLVRLHDVTVQNYYLLYDHGWCVDLSSLRKAITATTRAIILIHPHNPTGMFLKRDEFLQIEALAAENNLALIVDEVFLDYSFYDNKNSMPTTAEQKDVLTFTLSGISKLAGMPQMKLGWIIVGGHPSHVLESCERLEILFDTYLSVNTPVQIALPEFMRAGKNLRTQILDRVRSNFEFLRTQLRAGSSCSLLNSDGGWYGILRLPRTKPEEQWCIELLEIHGVYVYPGYYFDFAEEGFLVVSLLTEPSSFKTGIQKILDLAG